MSDAVPAEPPSATRLFLVFAKIGLTSFGGGLSGWLMREFVQSRGWIEESEFLDGLAISQALPGINVTNLAIWIGYRLQGAAGAVAGFCGIVVPPAFVIILLASGIEALGRFPATRWALDGAAAAAVGLSLSMGLTVARRIPRRVRPLATCIGTFVAIGLGHLPLIPVVLGASLFSVGAEWIELGRSGPG